ncbi:MAG: LCP family protein [Tenericutes bacterium]|nr:LCP family protein [Mycoplasmatota bacterium]
MKKITIYKILSGILISLLVISMGFMLYTLSLLSGIETFYRIMFSILLILFLVVLTYSLLDSVKNNKKKKIIISSVLTILLSIILGVVSFYIYRAYIGLDNLNKSEITYTTKLISYEKLNVNEIKNKKIGILSNEEDITGYKLPNEIIDKLNLSKNNEIIKYGDNITLMSAFINNEVDLIFISDNYKNMFNNIEEYDSAKEIFEITSLKKVYKKKQVENTAIDKTKVTKPFTMLLLGIDSEQDDIRKSSSFNGDTIMMVTFDPETLSTTMFSIPRDTYVKMACGGRITKINHASWGGTSCMVKTVENLTGIKIDYYAKINFKGVVDLVNILGGINVDVPVKFCEQNSDRQWGDKTICLEPGMQKLDGEQALALARHRKTLPLGDFQRGQNQQLVVEGMIGSLKNVKSVEDFYKILDTIGKNMDTNMTTEEMLSFYNIGKNLLLKSGDVKLNITKTFLTGYDQYITVGNSKSYTFQYYKQSLAEIVKAMKINLGLLEKEEIKTFNFDLNTPYEKKIIGKTYYSDEQRVSLMPNLGSYTLDEAKAWASRNGFTLTVKEALVESETYTDGQIINQSLKEGSLLEGADKNITITIAKISNIDN